LDASILRRDLAEKTRRVNAGLLILLADGDAPFVALMWDAAPLLGKAIT
jgi:hypothetical protein